MCSPSLNKYSQVLFITCARSQRERGCKKKYDESRVEFFSLVFFSQPDEASFPHFFFPKKLLFLAFSQASAPSIRPKWPRPPPKRRLTNKFQREKSVSSGNSSTQTPLKRVSLSLSLSLSLSDRTKSKEGRRHRARALSLSRWRRLLRSPSPPLPRSSGVHPSRDAEEEEDEEARRRGRRLLHRMRRRGTTRTSTRRRKRYPPPTNARINRVKVKCGGQTLPLLLLLLR